MAPIIRAIAEFVTLAIGFGALLFALAIFGELP